MNVVTGIVVYALLWWIVFFTMLPVGVKTHSDQGSQAEPGHADSAPIVAYMWRKVLATTLIAAVVWGGYYWLQGSGLIRVRPDFHHADYRTD